MHFYDIITAENLGTGIPLRDQTLSDQTFLEYVTSRNWSVKFFNLKSSLAKL